jgi:hypothetical protein
VLPPLATLVQFFSNFRTPSTHVGSKTLTLDLRMIRRVVYHCAIVVNQLATMFAILSLPMTVALAGL